MRINKHPACCYGIKLVIENEEGVEIARARLYLMYNDLHNEPFGLMEDVFVHVDHRGKGLANKIVQMVIEEARGLGCYKLLATSRHGKDEIQAWYQRLGFADHGMSLRMSL